MSDPVTETGLPFTWYRAPGNAPGLRTNFQPFSLAWTRYSMPRPVRARENEIVFVPTGRSWMLISSHPRGRWGSKTIVLFTASASMPKMCRIRGTTMP
jgi:hypothetical protein